MDRRRLIQQGVAGGILAIGSGGFLFVRRSQAREAVASGMLDDALPQLTSVAAKGLTSLPARARDEIKRYFHGKCLNVEGFVSHICSATFAERIGHCRTPDERERCFMQAFCNRVATEAEILNRVETIATEIGSELDDQWTTYCVELSIKWNTRLHEFGSPLVAGDLTNRLSDLIRDELAQAARLGMTPTQRPALGQTIGKIGASAVLLLPLMQFGPAGLQVGIPVFVMLAAKHIWDYVAGRLDDRRGDYQTAISGRIAMLGNQVGGEFEREVRRRISDLHQWQERSLRETASRIATERVSLL